MSKRSGRLSGAVRALAAGVGVYVGVAACSAAGDDVAQRRGAGGAGHSSGAGGVGALGGNGGAAGAGGGLLDAAADVLADVWADVAEPVPDASAAPPDVHEVPCDKRGGTPAAPFAYAELSGLPYTAEQLAFARALAPTDPSAPEAVRLGDWYATPPYVSDGKVAVLCWYDLDHVHKFASVRIIVPAPL